MDSGQQLRESDTYTGATTATPATGRATLQLFNRRGSVLTVALGGVNTEPIASSSAPSHIGGSSNAITTNPKGLVTAYLGRNGTNCANTMTTSNNLATTSAGSSSTVTHPSSGPTQFESHSTFEPECISQANPEHISERRPCFPRLCAYHDCVSLAAAWGLGPPTTLIEPKPTGASQAQSPTEDDTGDGKSNDLLASCPAFRNELGGEPTRRLALSRRMNGANNFAIKSENETWQREHTAAEICILEDVSNVYLGGRLCAARQQKVVIEPQDIGAYYYRHCFVGRAHLNFFGTDDTYGPIAVSMVRENVERKDGGTKQTVIIYRMIIRVSDLCNLRVAIPEEVISDNSDQKNNRSLMKELFEISCPQINYGILRPATSNSKLEDTLLKIDEQPIYTRYKVGVMYCGKGQSTEEQMYNNENGSPAFEEFLDFLGERVRLKGFIQYKGGLDVRGDTTGLYSVYTEYQAHEIMFHVSTLLPFTPSNKQQLARKRHIGNDMVTVIFQEPDALPFSPITVRSHFQHVFIIVRANKPCTDEVTYSIAVSRAKDVPAFGPAIPLGATFQKSSEFHDFLVTKVINAENAVHRSKKFAAMAARTRREALKEAIENFASVHPNDGPSKIASRFLGGSVKRKERISPRPVLGESLRGAISWLVEVHDYSLNQRINCVLGISGDTFAILEMPSGEVIFATSTHSIIGWANTEVGLKIYYDHGDMLLMRCCPTDGSQNDISTIINRLRMVTKGDEAKEVVYRRARKTDSLGFHIQEEGVVTDVEMYRTAWKCGMRQGSRIVEINGRPVVTMSHQQIFEIMPTQLLLRLIMISPATDGSPRRGCADPHCPAVGDDDRLLLTPETLAKRTLRNPELFKSISSHLGSANSWEITNRLSNSFEDELINPSFASTSSVTTSLQLPIVQSSSHRLSYQVNIGSAEMTLFGLRSRPFKLSNVKDSSSVIDKQPVPILRTRSEEGLSSYMLSKYDALKEAELSKLRAGWKSEVEEEMVGRVELEKCQWQLEKTIQEKQTLEAMMSRLKEELTKERRAHDLTKLELQKLQKYFEMVPNVSL